MDKIIVDIEPHEVKECVELLRKAGYENDNVWDFAELNSIPPKSVKIFNGHIVVSYLPALDFSLGFFPITMPELREAVKLHYD